MKTNNILMILIILTFAGATWLITENNALKAREIDLIDKWFDVEQEIGTLENDVRDMKRQMNRIEMLVDEMALDYLDTTGMSIN